MSELINNREHAARQMDEAQLRRREELKAIIKQLHAGADPAQVKERFRQAVGHVEVEEISMLEDSLMREEGIPVSEVQRLCSVHASIFDGSISDIHGASSSAPEAQPGHPVHTFKLENRELERLTGFSISLHLDKFMKKDSDANRFKLLEDLNLLLDVDKHYSRKENLLFPYLERYGIYGPTQVMWGVDDGIRAEIKAAKQLLTEYMGDREAVRRQIEGAVREVEEMIFKEENILLPMALKKLTEDEWVKIAEETEEIGYCLIPGTPRWVPARAPEPGIAAEPDAAPVVSVKAAAAAQGSQPAGMPQWVADMLRQEREGAGEAAPAPIAEGFVRFNTGTLSVAQLELIMNHLPVDLTFIDENDIVRYFSHSRERIFARTKAVIGRSVQNCHPPQSVHVVEELLRDFKSGAKDIEDFWIPVRDKFVYIRYFAIRDEQGHYKGTLEFTQNIAPIQALEGQKRIMS
ncbi:PAS domain S-box protein [Saccharibacillus sp. O16]|nr:PAS domain S-box protein [Saccharibacillus sp. O16]